MEMLLLAAAAYILILVIGGWIADHYESEEDQYWRELREYNEKLLGKREWD